MAKNILIVDDSGVMRKMIARAIRQAGFNIGEVYEGANGVEGLRQLDEHPNIDLVLSDWNMPQMDGLTFVKKIRAKGNNTPIIMITTESNFAQVDEATKAGVDGYVNKPFTPDDLADKLKNFI